MIFFLCSGMWCTWSNEISRGFWFYVAFVLYRCLTVFLSFESGSKVMSACWYLDIACVRLLSRTANAEHLLLFYRDIRKIYI